MGVWPYVTVEGDVPVKWLSADKSRVQARRYNRQQQSDENQPRNKRRADWLDSNSPVQNGHLRCRIPGVQSRIVALPFKLDVRITSRDFSVVSILVGHMASKGVFLGGADPQIVRYLSNVGETSETRGTTMCRSIKTLRPPFEDAVTDDDVRAAALQYVRKISGFRKPSQANEKAFNKAVSQVAAASQRMLDALIVNPAPARS